VEHGHVVAPGRSASAVDQGRDPAHDGRDFRFRSRSPPEAAATGAAAPEPTTACDQLTPVASQTRHHLW
jgi:hypothetical protein